MSQKLLVTPAISLYSLSVLKTGSLNHVIHQCMSSVSHRRVLSQPPVELQ